MSLKLLFAFRKFINESILSLSPQLPYSIKLKCENKEQHDAFFHVSVVDDGGHKAKLKYQQHQCRGQQVQIIVCLVKFVTVKYLQSHTCQLNCEAEDNLISGNQAIIRDESQKHNILQFSEYAKIKLSSVHVTPLSET